MGEGIKRGQPVAAMHGCGDDLTCRDVTGPGDDAGHADAAFEHMLLFSREAAIEALLRAELGVFGEHGAVVAGEDDDRVLPLFVIFESLKHAPKSGVHGLDHGVGDDHGLAGILAKSLAILFHERFGGLQRAVRRVMREEDGEGFLFVRGDELQGLVVERVGEVASVVRHGVVIAQEIPFQVILAAIRKAVEKIETALMRQVIAAVEAIVPLANERGGVARMAEVIAKGFFREIEPVQTAIARHIHRAGAVVVTAREETCPRG